MKYQVIYYSETGNTEKIAKTIFEELPGTDKDIQRITEYRDRDADLYFLGFWVYHGAPSMEFLDFLSGFTGKKVALFATCGMGNADDYYQRMERQVMAWLPEDIEYKGMFICQGKMPMGVRKACEKMQVERNKSYEYCERLITNFDQAMLRPDENDLKNARAFVKKIIE